MALAQQLLATGRGISGSAFFVDGMSSSLDPMFISDRAYRHAENVIHRGGVPRTRPGYRQVLTLPAGVLQGATFFKQIGGPEYIVFAVSGNVYAAQYPFTAYTQIQGVQMYAHAPTVYFATSTRSASRNGEGEIQATEPRRTLIIQDGGFTRAAYWDGISSGHSDPTVVSDSEGVLSAGIPLGGPCAFSGDRLWVAQNNKLFASDIADPLSFVENDYAAEGGFFAFDDDITALAEVSTTGSSFLVVFTNSRTYAIRSGIRDRSKWKATDDFKATLFETVGCVSHRGVRAMNGLLWWMSQTGLTNLNFAQQAQVSSRLPPLDSPMAVSKANLAADLSGVALGAFENFLLVSVPHASKHNTHTWVLDQVPVEGGQEASWASVWTGTRPVEWVIGQFSGTQRAFYVSKDYDGQSRLWEAFSSERTDNGYPIQCFLETKTHNDFSQKATGLDMKRFEFAETSFTDLLGDVDISVYYAGTRGKYKLLAEHEIVASTGSASAAVADDEFVAYLPQSRVLRTPNVSATPEGCSSCGVESTRTDREDVGFSLLIQWTGQAGLRSYRIFADPIQESGVGAAEAAEVGPRVLDGAVCE